MNKNFKNCYYNTFLNRRRFALKIRNKGNLNIQFILQYSADGGVATKKSNILTPGQTESLFFPETATNIYFNVLNYSLPSIPLICNKHIPVPQGTCYEVHGTAQNPTCVECTP